MFIRPVIQADVVAEPARADQPGRRDDSTDAAPVIRVHIGRIQVLGTRPLARPASPHHTPRPEPALTLSDYLKRLEGESR